MSKNKYTTVVCIAIITVMLITTVAFMAGSSLGVEIVRNEPAYVQKLFSTDKVHTIDIVVKEADWDTMITNAQAEEYIQCSVIIDGESVKGVGIRPKGNSSLSTIANSDSDRYSFKIEFDHYEKGKNYFGLDKLVLNNIAQDNTYMKDYVTYQMMNAMGADAPLSSFIWITVNGEDWGLYMAAESIEESFAQRVYGNGYGEIYKPDTMDMGGMGRNNENRNENENENAVNGLPGFGGQRPNFREENGQNGGNAGGANQRPDFGNMPGEGTEGQEDQMPGRGNMPNGENTGQEGQMPNFGEGEMPDFTNIPGVGGGFGSFSGSETSLIYTDDDPDSYFGIFDNAAFDPSNQDKARLISSLKQLNEGENIEQVVNVDEVIRYFVVHNFVLNSDSYTGSIVHNYYLAENNGQLSMIAWDYNLAFGGMGAMGGDMGRNTGNAGQEETSTDNASKLVNYPIDSPMLSGSIEDKPMIAWIFNSDEYLESYHKVFTEYMEYFDSGKFSEMYDKAIDLITPYVEKDPSAFCSVEDFQKGSSTLREFCLLRAESIKGQLNGTIGSTSEEQTAEGNAGFIDASEISIESMGSNSMGFGRARGGQFSIEDNNGEDTFTLPQNGSEESDAFPQNNSEQTFVFPGNNGNNPPGTQAMAAGRTNAAPSKGQGGDGRNEIILLAVCAAALVGGMLFARKRRM